jgi:hypothetical protein
MYKFIKTKDANNKYEVSDILFNVNNDVDLFQLTNEFSMFLKSCGYHFETLIVKDKNEEIDVSNYTPDI